MNLTRKLQILQGEWFEESMFKSDDVAALYAFYQPTQGPFIIVPSFKQEEATGEFTLTSKFFFLFHDIFDLQSSALNQCRFKCLTTCATLY
jgi:hypothetical protein